MHTITFTCETITPMFLSGADGQTPELRPPSIKGALRFWWRAMNGHLSLADLKKREAEIFGDTSRRSRFSLKIVDHHHTESSLTVKNTQVLPHKDRSFSKAAIQPQNTTFTIEIKVDNEHEQLIRSLFELTVMLGGIGGRSRRGFGAMSIKKINDQGVSYKDIEDVLRLLQVINNGKFYLSKDQQQQNCIFSKFGRSEPYPFIKQIQLGRREQDITKRAGKASHDTKGEDDMARRFLYASSLGNGNRFASPIFVSVCVLQGIPTTVITTLNTAPKSGKVDTNLQESFKNKIL